MTRPAREGRRALLLGSAGAGLAALLARPRVAEAGLSTVERELLERGRVVRRPLDVEIDGAEYLGGLGYVKLSAPAATVLATLADPDAKHRFMPLVLDAKELGTHKGDRLVYFRQGGKVGSAAYVLRVRTQAPTQEGVTLVRFWCDLERPRDLEDAWGFFRVEPDGPRRTLLSYGVLFDLGFGVTKLLFAEKVRTFALQVPELLGREVSRRPW